MRIENLDICETNNLSDRELEGIYGGALVEVENNEILKNVLNNNNVDVDVDPRINVAANVLSSGQQVLTAV